MRFHHLLPPFGEGSFFDTLSAQDYTRLMRMQRGLTEVHAQRFLRVTDGRHSLFMLVLDGAAEDPLGGLRAQGGGNPLFLALTKGRAHAIGLKKARGAVLFSLYPDETTDSLTRLAFGAPTLHIAERIVPIPKGHMRLVAAALDLAKHALCIPAVLLFWPESMKEEQAALEAACLWVTPEDIAQFHVVKAQTLRLVSRAAVPLEGDIATEFHVFRDACGVQISLVLVGEVDPTEAVPVRIHSSCLTGDIFSSRRCDCGAQLRSSLEQIKVMGGGAVVYLEQEGRALGLANKMRAYNLQNQGIDTFDANTQLGFETDERDYHSACRVLKKMGWTKIKILTNNPIKIAALRKAGLTVVQRLPVQTPIHAENRRYLEAKVHRAGHKIDLPTLESGTEKSAFMD